MGQEEAWISERDAALDGKGFLALYLIVAETLLVVLIKHIVQAFEKLSQPGSQEGRCGTK